MKYLLIFILFILPIQLFSLEIGKESPDFTLTNLKNEKISLDSLYKNGPVILDFCHIHCKPCLKELPILQKIFEKYKDKGLTVVAIDIDGPALKSRVKSFFKGLGITFPVLLDSDMKIANKYSVNAYPTSFIIGMDGIIKYISTGYKQGDEKKLIEKIEELLIDNTSEDNSAEKNDEKENKESK